MTTKYEEYLEQLMKAYEPYADIAGAEIEKIDTLTRRLQELKDPEWVSFREHPIAVRLFKHSANVYRASCMAMLNDDGSLTKEDRMRLHVSKLWAMWYIRALGGDPKKIKKEVEAEIERFADAAGIKEVIHSK